MAGRLGHAAAGLALLRADLSVSRRSSIEAHRRPRPPYACGPEAAALGATAMLDVSDGLLQDLGHVAKASGVALVLDPRGLRRSLPRSPTAARQLGADPLDWVLTGGEDHALAATFPAARLSPAWTVVGHVSKGKVCRSRAFRWTAAAGTTSVSDVSHLL